MLSTHKEDIYLFMYLRFILERAHIHKRRGGATGEGENIKQTPTEHRAHREAWSHDTKIMTKPKSRGGHLSEHPRKIIFLMEFL